MPRHHCGNDLKRRAARLNHLDRADSCGNHHQKRSNAALSDDNAICIDPIAARSVGRCSAWPQSEKGGPLWCRRRQDPVRALRKTVAYARDAFAAAAVVIEVDARVLYTTCCVPSRLPAAVFAPLTTLPRAAGWFSGPYTASDRRYRWLAGVLLAAGVVAQSIGGLLGFFCINATFLPRSPLDH